MHNNSISSFSKQVYLLSKKIIKEKYPEELDLFNVVWGAMKDLILTWIDMKPENWPINKSQEAVMSGLGFTDLTGMPDLVAPKIIAVIAATLWHMSSLKSIPKDAELERIIKDYSNFFKLPFSFYRESNLKQFLTLLCREEAAKYVEKENEKEIRREIFVRGKHVQFNEMKMAELKSRKDEFDIWICRIYIDLEDEIIIDKTKVVMQDQPLKLLICLLKSSGRLCSYPEVFMEAWGDPNRNSNSFERRKIVQAWKKLKQHKFLSDNIETVRGKGFFVKKGILNYCLIYSTQLFS